MSQQIDLNKLLSSVEKTVTSSSLYLQSFTLIICFIFSYFVCGIIRKKFFPKVVSSPNHNQEFHRLLTRCLAPLSYPILSFILIAISSLIYFQFFKEGILFLTTLKLIALFIFLRFLRISSGNNFVSNSIGVVLISALVLQIFSALDSTIFYLDEIGFKIGSVRVSVYLAIKAFIVLILVFWLGNLISRKSKYYIQGSKNIKPSTKNIISKFIDIFLYSTIVLIILKTFGVDMTAFAVVGGAIGVGIGFGLQKIASNFISGVILLFEKSVEIGDIVELDNGNIYGTVKHFGGRYTLVEINDGKEIMIPNEEFIINKVTNWSYSNNRARIEINVGVAYGSDLEKTKEIMTLCAKECSRCLTYPEIECFVTSFGDFDIKLTLYFWISDIIEGRMGPKSEVMIKIYKKFAENKIEIPLPKREVKLINNQ
jgi:small-conductance mechanosensitive channel